MDKADLCPYDTVEKQRDCQWYEGSDLSGSWCRFNADRDKVPCGATDRCVSPERIRSIVDKEDHNADR